MRRSTYLQPSQAWSGEVSIAVQGITLEGMLDVPAHARGLVVFAHGSGSSRHSSRNRHVAEQLQAAGLGTLRFDLLTEAEGRVDDIMAHLRFDINLLAARVRGVTAWAAENLCTAALRVGYFGASTGAAAALVAAADEGSEVGAVVSRGGRPDLAGEALGRVRAPTLLIVGGEDEPVITLNQEAFARLKAVKRLEIVPQATHLFEEPGTLDRVAQLAAKWFADYLPAEGWHP